MTKILLVEDDKSLREIYGVRLLAEGYDVVSAADGEVALAMAIKERPALIITDVMMPKISGFDMLDILRSTTETKDIKVIVMTALGSEENKDRGERLGANRYLVKSQVGIEDVVRTVHELLGDTPSAQPGTVAAAPATTPAAPSVPATPQPTRPAPPTPVPQRTSDASAPTMQPPAPAMPAPAAPQPTMQPVTPPPVSQSGGRTLVSTPAIPAPGSVPGTIPVQPPTPMPSQFAPQAPSAVKAEPPSRRTRIIQPLNDPDKKVNIQDLVEKELAKEGSKVNTADEERQVVNDQIDSFVNKVPAAPAVSPAGVSTSELPTVTPSEQKDESAAQPASPDAETGSLATGTPTPAAPTSPPATAPQPASPPKTTEDGMVTPSSSFTPPTPPAA